MLLLPAAVLSCNGGLELSEELSCIKVDKTLLGVGPEAEVLNVDYTIEGPAEGLVPDVSVNDAWISVGENTGSSITLNIAANNSGADRLGSVKLSGEKLKDLTLYISQSKVSDASTPHNSFVLDVGNVTTSSLALEVSPVNPTAYYYTNLLTEATYLTMSEAELVAAYAANILEYAAVYQIDPHSFLYQGYFNSAESEAAALDLRDDTDYRVFAFDLDFDAQQNPVASGKVESVKVRTSRASQVQMTFDFEKKSGAVVTVKPSTSAYSYICGIASKSQWDEYADKKDAARDYIDIAKQYNMFETILFYGQRDEDFMYLVEEPGVYVVYAVGYRNSETDRGITTDIQFKEFTF